MRIEHFTFNAFAENTYLLIGESKDTILIDPGMMDPQEEQQLFTFISEENLRPIRSMNTHCHIDHVLGIHAVNKQYSLSPEFHLKEQMVFDSCERVAQMYGIPYLAYTGQVRSLDVGDTIDLDGEELELRLPGSSGLYQPYVQSGHRWRYSVQRKHRSDGPTRWGTRFAFGKHKE